ncbi:MAG: hypothetical protein IH948_04690, partial [Bacteroidetes bacterium]|nr:hypothetical protein [Bacteroidota bacterium]
MNNIKRVLGEFYKKSIALVLSITILSIFLGMIKRTKVIMLAIALAIVWSGNVEGQNTYAEVTGVGGSVVTLAAGHAGTFVVGELAMIMQMKGASVSEGNNAGYGAVTGFNNAGTYAFATVLAVSATSVTLDINVDAYDVTSNVQLISIPPDDGSGNYVEDGSNEPPEWDGHTGGVYAMS